MRFHIGQKYTGQAIELKPYGAVLKLDDGSTALLHISNIADTFIEDVSKFITVGEFYEVTAVPGKIKTVELTLKNVDLDELDIPNEDDMSFDELLEQYLPKPDHRDRPIHRKYNKDK